MRKLIGLAVVGAILVAAVLGSASYGAFSSGISTKSKLFQDYLVEGYYNLATEESQTIDTSLDYVKAFGVTVSNESVSDQDAAGVLVGFSGGDLTIKSKVTTTESASHPSGRWWAIGK